MGKIVKFCSSYSLGTECKPVLFSQCYGTASVRPHLLPLPFTIQRKRKKKNSTGKCESNTTNLQDRTNGNGKEGWHVSKYLEC